MLNRSASLAMSTSVLKALPAELDIKRHSPSILYIVAGVQGDSITLSVTTCAYIIAKEEEDKQLPAQLQTQSQRARRGAVRQF